jgi:PTH1 family peptidyl-tRNA hydrolase
MFMLLLVGLGNPGARYAGTRHNIGFMAVQEIAKRHGIGPWRPHFQELALACNGSIDGTDVLLLLPGTFMNESGRAVAAAVKSHRLSLGDIIVFHDDIERRPANVKVKINGGDRGHNGLRSISAYVGKEYRRVQIGVGRPEEKYLVESYVLSKFIEPERRLFSMLIKILADRINLLVRGEVTFFEREVASATKQFGDWPH